jgi:hypothetical protein
MLDWSRERAHWIARNIRTANGYFERLPFRRSLGALLADKSIWVNYEDNPKRYGATDIRNFRDIAISSTAFRQGRWVVLATLIHELAHVGGAPGFSHAAEQAVLECGLGLPSELRRGRDDPRTPYEPNIIGLHARPGQENVVG